MRVLQIRIDENIRKKLQELAKLEGRTESELVREAIAKLLRERGFLEGGKNEENKHRDAFEKSTA
jgi:predicted transcriptional regulator